METAFTVCPHDCPSTCALEVECIDPHTIGRVHGAKDNSYTDGVICAKVARYAERIHHPDRLGRPLRRCGPRGSGEFVPIGWEEALDEVTERFVSATEQFGPETVWPYFYAGTMGLVQRDGIDRLRHEMKYSRQKQTICTTLASAGWRAGVGACRGVDGREMADSDLIIVWGANASATQVNVMSHISKARKTRGAKLIVVDPYRNATAEVSDQHVCLRPGTDGALACAMMHVLFAEGFADRDYLRKYTDMSDKFEAHLEGRTPAWAARITGLEEKEITEFARNYGHTKKAYLRIGYGLSRSRNGAANMHAVSCLPAVTGAWKYLGGGALFSQSDLYHLDTTLIEGLDMLDRDVRELDMSRIGPVLTGDPSDLGEGPPVTAIFLQNTNPMVVAPEHLKVRKGFEREDLFVCVHEQFMTESAKMADIVLPATTFLEHDDFYIAGGHTHIQMGARVVEPFAEARSNHEVICALAARLNASHPGFEMTAWEMIDATLKLSGYPGAMTLKNERWYDCREEFTAAHFLDGFATPNRRFHFSPDWQSLGSIGSPMPSFPDHFEVIEQIDMDHPFRLITAPARNFLNSSFTETPGSQVREGRPSVLLHPTDAEKLDTEDGELVVIGNRRGEVTIHVKLFDGLLPGVVVVESVWPNSSFVGGVGINALTGADSPPPDGGAAFHDNAVWIQPA